ncbi:MAG: S8 family serine peptidase [Cyanobacteriota bacterium]|nr:S8 family serine peptidase [Cyanobacteriota bacterium]
MADLFGTPFDDTLYGELGNNSIVGYAGDDAVYGGSQQDLIFGNSGLDFLLGSGGDDTILAGRDSDYVSGGFDNDVLFGNLGADFLYGSDGIDEMFGGRDDDFLAGGTGNDRLSGDLGRDTLIGVERWDFQAGAGEIDTLTGGAGADFFVLGDRFDSYYASAGDSDFALITDYESTEDTIAVSDPNTIATSTLTLAGFGMGMGIFETALGTNELIAFLPGVTQAPDLYSTQIGYGAIDASAAVAAVVGESNPFPEIADSFFTPWGINRVNAPEVWAQGYTGEGVVVAVIDSGVDYTHPDLADNIWNNTDEIAGNGIDDDGNGYIDDTRGWDFVDGDRDPNESLFSNGHGTHVAGTIAAADNGFGVTGVAPDATIMPIRVLGAFGGQPSDVGMGIRYAADNGADVINLSLGGGYFTDVEEAIQYATERGVLVVMASGNEGNSQPTYPARGADQYGIAVGAIDIYDTVPNFSNEAGRDLDYVVAPGASVRSTLPNNRYGFASGTSFAAPHVSGVAALMLSANPDLTLEQVEETIVRTADPTGILA